VNKDIKRETKKSSFFYSYLITDPTEYGLELTTFKNTLRKTLQTHKVDILCFRDKITKDIKPFAQATLKIAKEFKIKKILINGNRALALELGFDGVHLTSTQFDEIKISKEQKLFTFISCHKDEDVNLAKKNGADGVTYSPIFYKQDKGEPKGCTQLENIVKKYQSDRFHIIALGGITTQQKVQKVKETSCSGFASITYFTNNL